MRTVNLTMEFIRPLAKGYVDRDSWIYVNDAVVHRRPTGDFGYQVVPASQAMVAMNWIMVFSHHFLFVPLDVVSIFSGSYLLNTRGFHHPVEFSGLGSVREFAPIYAFAPWLDESLLVERPTWL